MKNLTLLTSVAAMLPTSATTDRVKGMPVITSRYIHNTYNHIDILDTKYLMLDYK